MTKVRLGSGESRAVLCRHFLGRVTLCVGAVVFLGAPQAAAQLLGIPEVSVQMPDPGEVPDSGPIGVLDRPKPELKPQGIPISGTLLFPSITATSAYNSNIFATQANPTSDVIVSLRPELSLDSGPRRVSYRFNGYGELAQYLAQGQLSNLNGGASLGISAGGPATWLLESRTAFVSAHQDPASFSSSITNGTIPTLPAYTTFLQGFSAKREVALLGASLDGSYQRQDYQNVVMNGVLLNQALLNGSNYSLAPKLSYLVSPPTRMFVQGTYSRQKYDTGVNDSGTYTAVVGSEFEFRRLIRGTVNVGYRQRVYDDPAIGSVGALTYGINVAWFPTELMTIKLSGKQDFSDSAVQGTGGTSVVNTRTIQGEVDYEVLRQVVVSGTMSYENDTYQSTNRQDNIVAIGTKLNYSLNAKASLLLQYLYSARNSSSPGFSYDRQQIGIGLKLQY